MIKLSQAETAVDGVNLAEDAPHIGASPKFFNRSVMPIHVTSATSTKGFGRGVGGFSYGTPLSGLLAF